MASVLLEVFRPAVEAARIVLRELDDEQVPADLKKVAAYSGGSLPPPLALSLLRALERYGWLRERVGERLASDDDLPSAASLLVEQPDGWLLEVLGRVEAAAAASHDAGASAATREVAALKERLATAKAALKEQAERLDADRRALKSALEAERRKSKQVLAGEARTEDALAARLEAAEAEVEAQRAAITAAEAQLAKAAENERALRRERKTIEAALAEATTGALWLGSDPVALAGHLDDVGRMARPFASDAEGDASEPARLQLPKGTAPDAKEAVDWLLSIEQPTTVVFDGYNVGFLMTGTTEPEAARRRLLPEVERIGRLATGSLRTIVVFDSSVASDAPRSVRGGVVVRFTQPGVPADEDIARLVASMSGHVIVVSSDRWVREVTEAAGAVGLWSEAFVGWAGSR